MVTRGSGGYNFEDRNESKKVLEAENALKL